MQPWTTELGQIIKGRRDFLIVVAILVIGFAIYYPHSFAAMQRRNMAMARAHIPVVQKALGSDPRFSDIQIHDFTANGGCLSIRATVQTAADVDRLKEIVAATSPPTAVNYLIFVNDDNAIGFFGVVTDFSTTHPTTAP
jgi:hypothetical protein